MKKVHKSLLWAIVGLFALAFNSAVNAQDDLYYDPATDAPASTPATYTEERDENNNVTRRYNDDGDGYYDDDDDYAYEYSSRIRRFQRRSQVVDYYDPFFVDLYNYDPFYSPGTSIYVYNYNDYWSYRRWRRWHRWNSWNSWDYGYGGGWNTWGWQSSYAYSSPWYNPWVTNNYYYDPYWTCNGYNPYYQNHHYGNGWSNNHYYYDNNNSGGGNNGYSPKTYTGPRRGGSHINPGYARIPDSKGRLATAQTNVPMVDKTSTRPGRTAGDIEGTPATGRTKTASERATSPNISGRRPEGTTAEPAGRTRNPETTPTGRDVEIPSRRNDVGNSPRRLEDEKTRPSRTETPSPRNDEGYKPRRSEETPSSPQRTETPSRRKDNDGGGYTPRRSEPTPSRTEESRPARRSEERTHERPSRSNNGGGDSGSTQERRPSRSSDNSGSVRSSSGSSTRSSDSGNSKSSNSSSNNNSSSKSGGSGRGGRN
ncbi:MAG: hypothetical protein ACKVUS_02955 [Saprospiraceae bacterium]